ncbi:MAG TPA: AAA family ATPase [Anaerolineales bacterium]|nr:AAA family ATPase [Anaerolineales bacterium]
MPPDSSAIKIHLLGKFEVRQGEKTLHVNDWKRQKAAALFKRLAWERKLHKEIIVDYLWPNANLTSGSNNLYRALHEIRRTLNVHLGEGSADQIISFSDGILTLADSIWVDAYEYEKTAKSSNIQHLVENYPGDFLPDDLYEDWAQTPREHLRQIYRDAVLSSAEDKPGPAIEVLTSLLTRDPLDEPVHRALMKAYALTGRRHEALRQYKVCADTLDANLGITPDYQTTSLYEQILQGEIIARTDTVPKTSSMGIMPLISNSIELEKDSAFVGRQNELDQLVQSIEKVQDSRGSVILLAGDTGVGKTRLAYEALQRAASSGLQILLGTCYEQEGQLPYQPFIEAFNRYLSDHNLPADQNPIINFQRLGVTDPQQEQWALFNATTSFLNEIAQQTPIVFLVDDLHAADETSLSLFHFLARQTRYIPLILLATYRKDIPSIKSKPFGVFVNALYRERLGEKINVNRLRKEDVIGIVTPILNGNPDPALVQGIFEATEGNPFFIEEVIQSLLTEKLLKQDNDIWHLPQGTKMPLPSRLTELLLERVESLGEDVKTALVCGAVLGREFRFEILRDSSRLSDGDVLDALDTALSAHLLEETDTGYKFRHSLIRRVLYDTSSRARRSILHTRAAEAIESSFSDHGLALDSQLESLAYHYLRSTQRKRALTYLLKAGEQASSVYALEVAIKHYEDALSLMDEFNMDNPAQRWKIHESLGWWYDTLADIPRSIGNFERALALTPAETWKSTPSDRARLHRAMATVLITGGNLTQGESHLKAALTEVDENEDASDYALVLYTLSQYYWHKNEYQEAFDAAQKSMKIAERLNDQDALANAFEMLALTCHSLGEWQSGLKFEQQRASLAGHELDVTSAFDVHL